MRIGFVTAGLREQYSGAAVVVCKLATLLASAGCVVTVHSAEADMSEVPASLKGVDYRPTKVITAYGKKLIAPGMMADIEDGSYDWLHIHGVWLHPFLLACLVGRRRGTQVLLSPHGMLSDFSFRHNAVIKNAWWLLQARSALQKVSAFHVTSDMELTEVKRLGFRQPIHIIPNGVADVSDGLRSAPRDLAVLFLSRLHPKKGLRELLAAWAKIVDHFPGWKLQIAGPDECGMLGELRNIVRVHAIPRVGFMGPAYGAERDALMRRASLFVLPSHDENFGLVVGEALANETPVVTSTRTPWRVVREERCGWWVPPTVEELATALSEAMSEPAPELRLMGLRGRELIERRFSWDAVVTKFISEIYSKCNGTVV